MIDAYLLHRARAAAVRLGHVLEPWRAHGGSLAYAECSRPGCNMGATIDTDHAHGAAVTFNCASRAPVAESQTA